MKCFIAKTYCKLDTSSCIWSPLQKVYIHPSVSNDSAYTKHLFDPVLYHQRAIYRANFLLFMYLATNIFFSNGTSEKINVPWIILQVYLNDVCSPGNKVICLNYILLTRKFLASIKKFKITLVEYFSKFILILLYNATF